MSILLTHQNSLAFGMLHVVQNTFNTKLIRYDLNSIILKIKVSIIIIMKKKIKQNSELQILLDTVIYNFLQEFKSNPTFS